MNPFKVDVFRGGKEVGKVSQQAEHHEVRKRTGFYIILSEKAREAIFKFSGRAPKENEEKSTKLGNSGSH